MITKKTYLILLIGLLSIQFVHSQFTSAGGAYNRYGFRIKLFDYSNEPIDGSPYLYKEYSPAKISIIKEICLVNFDAYNNKMEIEKNGKIYYLPQNNFKYDIRFLNSKKAYQLFNFEKNEETITGFFLIITKNKDTYLLIKEVIKKFKAKKATNGYEKPSPITFKRLKDRYYVCFKNNKAIKIPSKKKHFLNLFNNKKTEISDFMKKEKLKHKTEKDLIKIFNYYASVN